MSKLLALLAAILLAANAASAFRTITTTTIVTDEPANSDRISQECRRDFSQRDLTPCLQFLKEEQGPRGINHPGPEFDVCCNELRSFERSECTCEVLQAVMDQATRATSRPESLRGIMETAERLPGMCKVRPSTCKFQRRSI